MKVFLAPSAFDVSGRHLAALLAVFQEASGPVGFGRRGGEAAIGALVQEAVAIELVETPRWRSLTRVLPNDLGDFLTCTAPDPTLMNSLARVDELRRCIQENILRERYGRQLHPLPENPFAAGWVMNGRMTEHAARWLTTHCTRLIAWRFSEWGSYAQILSPSESLRALREGIESSLQEVGVATELVASERELPVW